MAPRGWIPQTVLLLVGIAYVVESLRLGLGSPHSPRSGFLPFFTAATLSLLAIISIIRNFAHAKKAEPAEVALGYSFRGVALIVVALFAYVVSLPWLGYLLGTFFMLLFLFRAGGIRNFGMILVASLLTTGTSFFVFDWCLNLRFPRGILGF